MAANPSHTSIGSILILDDSIVQRQHAIRLFRELGIEAIYEAADGMQALELLSSLEEPPRLIVIDLEMPGMNGVEFIQQMARRGVLAPFVVVSGKEGALISAVENMAHAFELPVLGAWQKPLTIDQLASVLHRQLVMPPLCSPTSCKNAPNISAAELAAAIVDHQLRPYYQPKVDLKSGLIRGVEALARWLHAEKGFIPPDHFIPVAENYGLIHDLTLDIAGQAFAQAAKWNQRGFRLTIAVNLSPLLLDSPDFIVEVDELLSLHRLSAEQVVWEVTESSLAADLGMALGNLVRLRLKGFGLSIDDYGTGFASMQQLSHIPFSELKVDRSFVHGANQREHLRIILQSALDMARKMRLVTVAEGIETLEDWKLLQEFGCALGQGYFIAKPMPGEALPGWIKENRARLLVLRA